jgi:hypothetical protein
MDLIQALVSEHLFCSYGSINIMLSVLYQFLELSSIFSSTA